MTKKSQIQQEREKRQTDKAQLEALIQRLQMQLANAQGNLMRIIGALAQLEELEPSTNGQAEKAPKGKHNANI